MFEFIWLEGFVIVNIEKVKCDLNLFISDLLRARLPACMFIHRFKFVYFQKELRSDVEKLKVKLEEANERIQSEVNAQLLMFCV